MTRLRRALWGLAGGLLIGAMPLLWIASYVRACTLVWLRGGGVSLQVASSNGRMAVWFIDPRETARQPPQLELIVDRGFAEQAMDHRYDYGYDVRGWRWLHWVRCEPSTGYLGVGGIEVVAPHWLLSVPSGLILLRIIRLGLRRHRRRRQGLCLACGYDLRHTPVRCPECGTAVDAGRVVASVAQG